MLYKNPIPQVEPANKFRIATTFTFENDTTRQDATRGITAVILQAIENNNGELPIEWLEYADK